MSRLLPRGAPAVALVVIAAGMAALGLASIRASRAGRGEEGAEVSAAERTGMEDAARLFARLSAHLKGSGGDRRFAERIPAAPEVVGDLLDETAFAASLGRIEEPHLQGVEYGKALRVAAGRAQLDAREYWVTRIHSGSGTVLETRSDVISVRYLVEEDRGRWTVIGWNVIVPGGAAR